MDRDQDQQAQAEAAENAAVFIRLFAFTVFASCALAGVGLSAGASIPQAAAAIAPVLLWALGKPNRPCGALVLAISAGQSLAALYLGVQTGAAMAFAIWTIAPALAAYAVGRGGALPVIAALAAMTALFVLRPGGSETFGVAQASALIAFAVYAVWATVIVEQTLIRAADRARQAERRKQMLLDNMDQAVLRLDSEGRIREACGGVMALFGVSMDSITGLRMEDMVSEADADAIDAAFQRAKYHNDSSDVVIKPRKAILAKSALRVKFVVAPRSDRADPFELIASIANATEALAQQDQVRASKLEAEAAREDRDRFLSNMSHELRTPLNALVGFSEILAFPGHAPYDEETVQDYAMHIYESAFGMAELVENLFSLAQSEDASDVEEAPRTRLDPVMEQCVGALRARFQAKGLMVKISMPDNLPLLLIDRRALRQILLNALSQSLRMMRPGGRIEITARQEDEAVRINIADNGSGLTDDMARRLMRPPVLESAPYVAADMLQGLWFAAIRNLAEKAGGEARVTGAPGIGTAVSVSLPCQVVARLEYAPTIVNKAANASEQGSTLEIPRLPLRARAIG